MGEAQDVVCAICSRITSRNPADMPDEWRTTSIRRDETTLARRVGDFIAGMTDRYALAEHARFFAATPELR